MTSKIVSIAEGRVVSRERLSKSAVVQSEADVYLGKGGHGIDMTIKHGLLIPSAGVDESNSESGGYILYPKDPYKSAASICQFLRKALRIKKLGVILTDSHSTPLRRGVTGIALAHWGIQAVQPLVGTPDIFGQPLKFTNVNVVDSLAAMAVFVMGEAGNRCPLAVISGTEVKFTKTSSRKEIAVAPKNDLYFPLLKNTRRAA